MLPQLSCGCRGERICRRYYARRVRCCRAVAAGVPPRLGFAAVTAAVDVAAVVKTVALAAAEAVAEFAELSILINNGNMPFVVPAAGTACLLVIHPLHATTKYRGSISEASEGSTHCFRVTDSEVTAEALGGKSVTPADAASRPSMWSTTYNASYTIVNSFITESDRSMAAYSIGIDSHLTSQLVS